MGNEENLNIVVRLQDEASQKLTELQGKFASLSKSIEPAIDASKTFAVGLLGVGTAVGAFGVMSVKSAADAEAAIASMDATLKTMGGSTDDVRAKILKASDSFVKLGIDDEAAAQGMALLYQRTGDVEQAIKLETLAADLSRAKHIELTDATKLVAMALSGNGRALLQYGIDIKDSATPLEALGELQKKVGGQADAFSKTLQGQMQVAQQSWDNFTQAVGENFLPAITSTVIKINDFIDNTLPKWIEKAKQISDFVRENTWVIYILAGAIIGALVPAAWAATVAFAAWAVALAPFLIGGAIIGGAIAGILLVAKNWDYVVLQFKSAVELLALYWKMLWDGFKTVVDDVWNGIKTTIGDAVNWVIDKINSMINAMNSVSGFASNLFGFSGQSLQIPNIPKFAEGGIVNSPTVGLIGEAGPEAVIPLSKMGGMGGNTTVIINNPAFNTREDEDRLRRMLDQYFRPLLLNNKI